MHRQELKTDWRRGDSKPITTRKNDGTNDQKHDGCFAYTDKQPHQQTVGHDDFRLVPQGSGSEPHGLGLKERDHGKRCLSFLFNCRCKSRQHRQHINKNPRTSIRGLFYRRLRTRRLHTAIAGLLPYRTRANLPRQAPVPAPLRRSFRAPLQPTADDDNRREGHRTSDGSAAADGPYRSIHQPPRRPGYPSAGRLFFRHGGHLNTTSRTPTRQALRCTQGSGSGSRRCLNVPATRTANGTTLSG